MFIVTSTRALGPAEAVELARALGKLPSKIRLIGIEAADWSFGGPLTAPAETAVDEVVRRLREALEPDAGDHQNTAVAG